MESKNTNPQARSTAASPQQPADGDASGLAGVPTTPLPPLVGVPDSGLAGVPTTPLPPVVGNPSTDPDEVLPMPPVAGRPTAPPATRPPATRPPVILPTPSLPNFRPQGEAEIRFLHAAPNYTSLRITVDARVFTGRLAYRRATDYEDVAAGVRTVTISGTNYPRRVYYRAQIPFRAGEVLTLAIIQTASGLDLVQVADSACAGVPRGRACIRAVNLVSGSSGLDVNQFTQNTIFSDVQFREITGYRRAAEGEYSFYVSPTGTGAGDALASFYTEIDAGTPYTFYILGTWGNRPQLRVEVLEDL